MSKWGGFRGGPKNLATRGEGLRNGKYPGTTQVQWNPGITVTLGTVKSDLNFGVAVIVKLLSTVYAYIVLKGTSRSGRYIEVAVKRGSTGYGLGWYKKSGAAEK